MVRNSDSAVLKISDNDFLPDVADGHIVPQRDTLTVLDNDGNELIIMKAVKDENGEMVANDVLDAAVVTAKFRNVAERNGKVDLKFIVTVPGRMIDSKWQMKIVPSMDYLNEKIDLEPVIITGKDYRKAQLRGYQQYERFINSIVTDTARFIWKHELEVFVSRNIPAVYELKTDSTFVSDEEFESLYGVTEREAVEHYTNMLAYGWNKRKMERKDRMFSKYVKVPIVSDGLRLDTVIISSSGDFMYEYSQSVSTTPELRKVDISLSGDIHEEDRLIYTMPENGPITFYISSLSSLSSDTERYVTEILERKVTANSTYWIDFGQGKAEIDLSLGDNEKEIGKIKEHLGYLMENKEFDMDSIIVTASCSPEGTWNSNRALSERRSRSVSQYFERFCKHYKDSLSAGEGFAINIDNTVTSIDHKPEEIRFISKNIPENWEHLKTLVDGDESIPSHEKEKLKRELEVQDPDERERTISSSVCYDYLLKSIYPQLRTVRFDFHLHRKGMVKDTVHTTVLDTVYMNGVQAIKDRDYQKAITFLRPYGDYNTAVAYCCLDYNESALAILENLEKTPQVNYLLAIVYSRKMMVQKAVQCYLDACSIDRSFIHRGNLDPEISSLIKQYNLKTF